MIAAKPDQTRLPFLPSEIERERERERKRSDHTLTKQSSRGEARERNKPTKDHQRGTLFLPGKGIYVLSLGIETGDDGKERLVHSVEGGGVGGALITTHMWWWWYHG